MTQNIDALASSYDLAIVGGGITGAGIFGEALRAGAKVLLVEQGDFASGTSAWSSKLVHGGLRYLKEGQWRLTLESVRERERLLQDAPGLVEIQPFLMPIYKGAKPGRHVMRIGLALYDLMAGRLASRWVPREELLQLEPGLRQENLLGAMAYEDARTDDTRLVLRQILEGVAAGGSALNYTRAELRLDGRRVRGLRLRDVENGAERDIDAAMVINAAGCWAGGLPGAPEGAPALRPLRGSHFVFPASTLPIHRAVSWMHPRDRRPIFAYPWEGAVLLGTTDLDHEGPLDQPGMSEAESAYLLDGLAAQFPRLGLKASDAISAYAGVRPIVASGDGDPSAASRESALWSSPGLVGVTGGKLTTFRVTARQALAEAARQLPRLAPAQEAPVFSVPAGGGSQRLQGRLGAAAVAGIARAFPREAMQAIGGTPFTWGELRWAARHERVRHLSDLMLRRTRLGLLLPRGGADQLESMGPVCREELGWDAARWAGERDGWLAHWQRQHAPR
ncbi:glycerol-3-phosphate dehydrogenase/oxidase [Solimonas sp. K1W22B-7]|uniref:glycerol-3-phosphate dehydrogenase/oxidase n=1 Tax=Solimonas sp. K1W22B-7 TaxID=2303331 RepID=UPI000E333451|nr:glycerol-3-phosphate dehydrogenase/oxidase [Solimonas sp. K1W22B-7]AXQ29213.1 glycerol-3-phosphate dehydrogenase/oxidase [Solimonas sp. K1W22B-7]